MKQFSLLEAHIAKVRLEMYQAYQRDPYGTEVLQLSQQLDHLLNELDRHKFSTSIKRKADRHSL